LIRDLIALDKDKIDYNDYSKSFNV
jgi:hypothetical protein